MSWHLIHIIVVCQADGSHEMSKLIFYEKLKKSRVSSTTNFAWCFNPCLAEPRYTLPLQTV